MTDFSKENYKVFELFSEHWALATAGNTNKFNTCTIGWGAMGNVWQQQNRPCHTITIYVHPSRYTCEFLKANDTFTVSFFPKIYRKALAYLGSHSGRDGDKVAASGLHPVSIGESMTFAEADLVFYNRKICQQQFAKDGLAGFIQQMYANAPHAFPPDANGQWQPHWMFIGEILDVVDKRRP